ncbi:MAG: hypothetical protein OHK0031_12090 [Anaerolineales bacterium]
MQKTSSRPSFTLWIALGILALLAVFAAIAALTVSNATQCGSGGSSFLDLWRVQRFGAGVFDQRQWQYSYSVQPYKIQAVWDAPDLSSIATLDYLLFNCGNSEVEASKYYSDENFKNIILADYQNVQKTAECRAGATRLYQFSAQFQGADYLLWQWVKPEDDRRVLGFFVAIPLENRLLALGYAEKLFPELTTCP